MWTFQHFNDCWLYFNDLKDGYSLAEMEGFDLHFRQRRKLRCHARPVGHEQQSTGLLHLDRFKSLIETKNIAPQAGCYFLAEMEGFELHFAFGKIIVRLGPALAGNSPPDCCI